MAIFICTGLYNEADSFQKRRTGFRDVVGEQGMPLPSLVLMQSPSERAGDLTGWFQLPRGVLPSLSLTIEEFLVDREVKKSGKETKKKSTGRRIVKQGREEAEREMGLTASLFGGDCPMKQQKLRWKEGSLGEWEEGCMRCGGWVRGLGWGWGDLELCPQDSGKKRKGIKVGNSYQPRTACVIFWR